MGQQETQLGKLQAEIHHTNEQMSTQFNAMKGEINSNFDKQCGRLEALLEKRQKTTE